MKKIAIIAGVATAAIAGGALALGAFAAPKTAAPSSSDSNARADCPTTVVCPLTGEEIAADKCPLCAKKSE